MPATTMMVVMMMSANVASLRFHPEGSLDVFCARAVRIFQKYGNHLKITGASRVTWHRYRTEEPQIFGASVHNVVARTTWRTGFVHPWFTQICKVCETSTRYIRFLKKKEKVFSLKCGWLIWAHFERSDFTCQLTWANLMLYIFRARRPQ